MLRAGPRFAAACAIACGALLRAPALGVGFRSDDHQQLAMLRGQYLLQRAPWDLFWFGPRTQAELARLIDFGFDPWWTSPQHKLSMLRPLSSLLIWLDQRVFGDAALWFHVHSLLWWVALCTAVATLMFRLLSPWTAALAAALFALDEAHAAPLAWLANRSALVCSSFGVAALLLHLQAGPRLADARRVASWCCWLLALAGGEYAFGLLAYLLAFELLGASQREGRLLRLAPPLGMAALYAGLRAALGYGVAGSAFYVSPTEPLRFLPAALERVPVMAADLLLGVPSFWFQTNVPLRDYVLARGYFDLESWRLLPDWQIAHVAIGVIALLAGVLWLRGLDSRLQGRRSSSVRWLLAGSALALLVVAGTGPSPRLLNAAEIGASALLASLAVRGLTRSAPRRARMLASLVLLVHVGLAARHAYADVEKVRMRSLAERRLALRAEIPDRRPDLDVVIVAGSDFETAVNLPWVRLHHGMSLPRSYRRLSGASTACDLVRIDPQTLELRLLSGELEGSFAGSIYRPSEQGFAPGDRVRLRGLELEVLDVLDGNPRRLSLRFDRPLEDPSLLFMHVRHDGLRRFSPPAPGQVLRLPRPPAAWETL